MTSPLPAGRRASSRASSSGVERLSAGIHSQSVFLSTALRAQSSTAVCMGEQQPTGAWGLGSRCEGGAALRSSPLKQAWACEARPTGIPPPTHTHHQLRRVRRVDAWQCGCGWRRRRPGTGARRRARQHPQTLRDCSAVKRQATACRRAQCTPLLLPRQTPAPWLAARSCLSSWWCSASCCRPWPVSYRLGRPRNVGFFSGEVAGRVVTAGSPDCSCLRPRAVFVDEPKINDEFFISILLTICGWLPGIIHAFW